VTSAVLSVVVEPYALVVPYATWEVDAVLVVQIMEALEKPIEAAETVEIAGGLLSTVTVMALLVALLPAVSIPTAVSVYEPSGKTVVFQEIE
jgi:hypothetical protein